jgi:hypothetical protein
MEARQVVSGSMFNERGAMDGDGEGKKKEGKS